MARGPSRRNRSGQPHWTGTRRTRIALGVLFSLVALYGWYLDREPGEPTPAVSQTAAARAGATDHSGRVVRVADGDSVEFRTQGQILKIRLDSVDAPEIGDGQRRPGQPFAEQSRDHLVRWLEDRQVIARCYETDQYGRAVCALIDDSGASAGQAQVRAGFAWAYTAARGKYLRDTDLPALQAAAQAARKGLWQQPKPTRPWQWRYDCWQKRRCN